MLKTIKRALPPKWWQIDRTNQKTGVSYIVCEHWFRWTADICIGLKSARGDWYFEMQCRAGCKECGMTNGTKKTTI